MIWDSPGYLFLLLLLPVLYYAACYITGYVREMRTAYFSDELFSRLQAHRDVNAIKIREGLFFASLFFLIIALAGPKVGTEVREVSREQLDLIVALDLSLSMKARDVRPSRLEKARFEISRMIDNMENDRVGLIVFTGHGMLHCPLTTDYSAFRMFLDIAEPDIMPSTTTDFRTMFQEAVSAFESSGNSKNPRGSDPARVLVIFSDGEDHFDRYSEPLQELMGMNVHIFAVGIGTEEGGRIPVPHPETGELLDYHRDRHGQIVTTHLVPETLREMAEITDGQYYQISRTAHNIEGFVRQLQQFDRSTFATEEVTEYRNRYGIPAVFGAICLIAMLLIPGYRRH